MRISIKTIATAALVSAAAAPALGQVPTSPTDEDAASKTAPPTPKDQLPPAESTREPSPPVAKPDIVLPPGGVISQAGVGGTTAYGRPGVLELGGSAGLMIAPEFRSVNVAPSIGWFLTDNFELSAIASVSNIKAGESDATVFSAFFEPSYHLPINRTVFGFAGLGIGGAYVRELGGGFAVAPRIGANFLVGRSGILTPALSYEFTTHDVNLDMNDRTALLAVSSSLRVNVGYTAMW